MIRLIRPEKPKKLIEEEKTLTAQFKVDNKKPVWKKSYIEKPLLKMSNSKCSYCEQKIGRGTGLDVHIDHFKCKNKYPELVVDWNNLLPSCSRCNRNKSTHDTVEKPIINPTEVDPKDFLFISRYRYYSKDSRENSLGRMTLGVLNLNDSDDCCKIRFQICNEIAEKIEYLYHKVVDKGSLIATDTVEKNKVINGCRKILQQCLPENAYSAFIATSLHNDTNFLLLKNSLIEYGLWDDDLSSLFDKSKESVYDTHR